MYGVPDFQSKNPWYGRTPVLPCILWRWAEVIRFLPPLDLYQQRAQFQVASHAGSEDTAPDMAEEIGRSWLQLSQALQTSL